jgi:hypothetical protein
MKIEIDWEEIKEKINSGLSFKEVIQNNHINVYVSDSSILWVCKIYLLQDSEALSDYKANYEPKKNGEIKTEVLTQYEKSDKTLRCLFGMAETDENGEAEVLSLIHI